MCMCADLLKSRSSEIQGGSPDDLPRFGRLNGIRRASLIPFNHQSGSKCKSSTLLLVCGFVTTNNGFLRQHPGCAPYTKHYSFGEDERLAATRGLCSRYHDFVNTITLGVTDKWNLRHQTNPFSECTSKYMTCQHTIVWDPHSTNREREERVCICMCVCVCVCIYIRICIHVCMKIYDGNKCTFSQQITIIYEKSYPYKCVYIYIQYTYIPIYIFEYIYKYVYIYVYIDMNIWFCKYICIYMYIYIYVYLNVWLFRICVHENIWLFHIYPASPFVPTA
jgi:hypothetical protein